MLLRKKKKHFYQNTKHVVSTKRSTAYLKRTHGYLKTLRKPLDSYQLQKTFVSKKTLYNNTAYQVYSYILEKKKKNIITKQHAKPTLHNLVYNTFFSLHLGASIDRAVETVGIRRHPALVRGPQHVVQDGHRPPPEHRVRQASDEVVVSHHVGVKSVLPGQTKGGGITYGGTIEAGEQRQGQGRGGVTYIYR